MGEATGRSRLIGPVLIIPSPERAARCGAYSARFAMATVILRLSCQHAVLPGTHATFGRSGDIRKLSASDNTVEEELE
jgi:hypothetical protein